MKNQKITVCLTAAADGTRKKPFIVFKGAKREVKQLNEQFKTKCGVASRDNGWMDEPSTEHSVAT